MDEKTIARFWSYVDKDGPIVRAGLTNCWLWTGRDNKGYGQFRPGSSNHVKSWAAHRFAWVLEYGTIPDGISCLHVCDQPLCVRADGHLFLGTQADNMADMAQKGRTGRHQRARGETNGIAKLTEVVVLEIRARYAAGGVTQCELAEEFGVGQSHVSRLLRGELWRHL